MGKILTIKNLQLRNDTSANWLSINPVLAKGEMGIEIDTRKFKFGDGATTWDALNYASSEDIAVDDAFDAESENPIQNKVVMMQCIILMTLQSLLLSVVFQLVLPLII